MHIRLIAIAIMLAFAPIAGAQANGSIHHNNVAIAGGGTSKAVSNSSARANSLNVNVSKGGNAAQGQKQSVSIEGDDYAVAVSGASAPGLTSGGVSCMGSVSGGGQGMTFGFSIGTTYEDERCNARQEAAALSQLGYNGAAVARLCMVADVRESLRLAGKVCPQILDDAAAEAASFATVDTSEKPDTE